MEISQFPPLDRGIHGLLAVNKPSGMTSKDVSRFLTRLLGKIKLGHVGTLDPMAEGVLPILLGNATRLQDYLLHTGKCYEFDLELGRASDTLDAQGTIIETKSFEHVTLQMVVEAVNSIVGEQLQAPPLYSAVKFNGKPLYDYGRRGIGLPVNLSQLARPITVYWAELICFAVNKLTIRLSCSKGTYIRSLGQDIANKLNTCGLITRLVRTKTSGIEIQETVTLDEIKSSWQVARNLESYIIPIEKAHLPLSHMLIEDDHQVLKLQQGQKIITSVDGFRGCKTSIEQENDVTVLLMDKRERAFGVGSMQTLKTLGGAKIALKRSLL